MGYDLSLVDRVTRNVLDGEHHDIRGSNYAVGGTTELRLSVTYNYAEHYYRVFGEEGIRTIYGMTGKESVPVLEDAISKLGDDIDDDYWKPTEGNAKVALRKLLALAGMGPDGIWEGD